MIARGKRGGGDLAGAAVVVFIFIYWSTLVLESTSGLLRCAQVRIERARRFVLEQCSGDIARRAHPNFSSDVDLRGRKLIKLRGGSAHRLLMRGDDSFIASDQGGDGHGFRRGEREVVEDTPICNLRVAACIAPRGLLPLG
jgi:hypothetical protein